MRRGISIHTMRRLPALLGLVVILTSVLTAGGVPITAQRASLGDQLSFGANGDAFRSSPVMFIENAGQWPDAARFQVWGAPAGTMWLAEDAMWITVVERTSPPTPPLQREGGKFPSSLPGDRRQTPHSIAEKGAGGLGPRAVNIKLSFIGANPHPRIEPFDRLDTTISYFIGNDPDGWRPDVPVWGGVRYVDLYPGVDLEITSEGGQMVQRLTTRPGADLSAVRLRAEGAEAVTVDEGTLRLSTAAGEFALLLLRADEVQIAGLQVQPRGTQAFDIAAPFAPANSSPASRDASSRQSKTANPQLPADNPADLFYGTFLGGSVDDWGGSIAVDGSGAAYVTGTTYSSGFPTTPGAFDITYNGGGYYGSDAFVVRVNPTGSALAYATFLGGSNDDYGSGIAVDASGVAYVTGATDSANFPAVSGPGYDTSFNGVSDAFVVKLNAAGSALAYATFLGGSISDGGSGIAVDASGVAYVMGGTDSADFPTTTGAFDRSYNGGGDAFVAKLAVGVTPTYTISGRVTDANGAAIPGVTVSAGSSSSTTDVNGYYTFTGLPAGTYNISPSRYLYAFSPSSRTVTVPPNATGQDFVQTPVVDLSVNRIEVAQVFVEENDPISGTPIPLIAEKDTLVRVYVGLAGAPSVYGVTARLHLRNAFGIERTVTESANLWPVQVTQNPDPLRLQDTINFRPPPEWLWGTITFWADIDPENRIPETNESNNTGGWVEQPFQPGKPLRIAWTMMGYKSPSSSIVAFPSWNVAAKGDKALRRIYPVGVDDVEYFYQPGILEVLTVKFNEETAAYRKAANRFWNSVSLSSSWIGGAPDRLYAWIPGEARDSNTDCGVGDAVWDPYNPGYGRVAIGAEECNKKFAGVLKEISPDEVMAHELGHILNSQGLRHTPNDVSAECFAVPGGPGPYPTVTPKGSIVAHGLDIERRKVLDPEHTYDFMTYCKPWWASPFNYQKLHAGFEAPPSSNVAEAQSMSSTRQLLVSGMVYSPTLRVELDPFYSVLSTALPSPNIGSDYCVEALAPDGGHLASRCFDLGFSHSEFGLSPETPTEVADSFALSIPYPSGTTRVVLTHLGTPIATRAVSQHAPIVRLLSPNGGETWTGSGTHTVTWTASDLDGDTLHFALSYSTDGGASWIPAGLDLTGTQHALDVSMLPGGTSVLLRISATDGVNTTDDVSDAPFRVGRKAPQAFILSPEDSARFFPGQAIWLEGRAFDLEDGALGDAALRWSSDRDGELGTGKLLITTLSPGEHTITLTATDADGARSTATIRLSAGDRIFLPLIWRAQ